MNRLVGTLESIEHIDSIHRLTFSVGRQKVHVLTLELSRVLEQGCEYALSCKSTHIAIAKELNATLSFANQLRAKITQITLGRLLASIELEVEGVSCESIIPSYRVPQMDLKINDIVSILIQESEFFVLADNP